jgi:hypothetical protein
VRGALTGTVKGKDHRHQGSDDETDAADGG